MKRIILILLLIGLGIVGGYGQVTIEIGDGTTTTNNLPLSGWYSASWSTYILTAEQIGNAIKIEEIQFFLSNSDNCTMYDQKLYLKHTIANEVTNQDPNPSNNDFTLVFNGDVSWNESGWQCIAFDTEFEYDGISNLQIVWLNNHGYTAEHHLNFKKTETEFSTGAYDQFNYYLGPFGTIVSYFPNTRLIGSIPGLISLFPTDRTENISNTPTLNLEVVDDYTNYEIYFGTTPNPETALVNFNPVTTPISYTFEEPLEYFTDYYWTVVLYDTNFEITKVNLTFKTRPEMEGLGTEESPYLVSTITDLNRISSDSYFWDKHFLQTVNIDASTTSVSNDGAGFSPIGNNDNSFTGTYDGQGYTISNLYINRPSTGNAGLLGKTESAEISNLGIINAEIISYNNVGSLVGNFGNSSTISNCYATGVVIGGTHVGGLVGNSSSDIYNSYSSASVNGSSYYVGGLVGGADGNSYIYNCYSTGAVAGELYAGGLSGSSDGNIFNSYAIGAVTGNNYVGGLVCQGYNGGGIVSNSFWDIETSGQTSSWGGTGITTEQMNNINTFLNAEWDFVGEQTNGIEDIWFIHPQINSGYPSLVNELPHLYGYVPDFVENVYPNSIVTNLACSDNLLWTPDYIELTSGYKINLGTDNPPNNVVSNEDLGLITSYEYSNLEPNTTYFWQVIPYNDYGDADNCPIWSFTTGSANMVCGGRGIDTAKMLPINYLKKRSYSQSLYLQEDLNLASRQIEKLAFLVTDSFNLTGANQWKVYLGHTNKTEFSSANDWLLPSQGLTEVADVILNESILEGWLEIELTTTFTYNNIDNLVVGIIEYGLETSDDTFDFYTADTECNRSLIFGHDSLVLNPYAQYPGIFSTSVPKIIFTFSEPTTRFTGLVKNSENNPLSNANVYIEELGTFPTNSLGEFNIHNVEAGTYQLVVSASWYETQTVEFEVIEGEDNYLEITLLEELLPANNVVATLAEDLSEVSITWSAPAISREANSTKGIASKTKKNLVQKQELEQRTGQPEVLYNLYRYGAGDEASPENWVEVATNLEDLTYADDSFSTLELGSYYWAVEAVYANDRLADATISNEILKQPYLESTIVEQIDFGVVYLTNASDYSQIILTNSGTGDLTLSAITCEEPAFNLVYDQAELVVEPDSTLTIQVNFAPTNPGVYMEDLIITNNSINEPNYTITLRGVCEYLPPKDPENVELIMSGNTGNISWDAVTEDINNNPITPDLYIVYYNGHNADVDYGFYFLASTTELSYNHVNVGLFSQFMLYQVKAYVDVDNALLSQIEDLVGQRQQISMKEVESLLKGEKRR